MSQHGETSHVTCSVNSRNVRAHVFVNLDAHRTTILVQKVLQAEIFGSKSIQIGPAPNGNENLVSANLLGLAFRVFIDNRIALDSGDFAAQAEVNPSLCVYFLKHRAYLIVQRP